ncbi:3-hydroxyacyl-CoA dehydrogenase/enoyl-CoA hydratase family protein [Dictyobacter formicarum]|uniref:3-hydroxyacyl-CoA dehydrogenase n=1 Tax=Dictyobacter formicarum TaxID=2778368 RepID=A0ABQ3VR61_9CHLR|nr:3-hydroxyacyl-CoA dehydrogenase/enoyl-CoA hydratase family protein [Dictyobacter formicarum]GHO88757.1 3-hydroxyacyl-CoA dehydrogenase [Dictyobacter formicarum]
MPYAIRKAAVIGAGVMGAAIAAHLANVGIPSLLLDIVPADAKDRNVIARTGLEKTLKSKPASFYSKRGANLVTIGNIEDDLPKLAEVDWIIEAVVERPDIKQSLYSKIEQVAQPETIISSNTSGLPAHLLIEGRSANFRRHFMITHFFNPVRYMRLLELVPTPDTDPELLSFMRQFGTEVLGKGIVICKDTPNFIANRIGVYGFLSTIHHALAEGYMVSEVDTILGTNMGRPKSAVFRTADLSGLDTLMHVANNLYKNAPEDEQRATFQIPEVVQEVINRGWLGEKSGQGFYKRVKNPDGSSTILELNLKTLEYEPQPKHRFDSIGKARNLETPEQKLSTVLNGEDRASQLARETTADALIYAANRAHEIADTIVDIDNAMRWGFNFDLGSFETWDVLLADQALLDKVFAQRELPALVQQVRNQGQGTFYRVIDGQKQYFDYHTGTYQPVPTAQGVISLSTLITGPSSTKGSAVVRDNGSASLIDLGDGVACLEFHTKMNSIDEGIVEMIHYAINEGSKQFRALVIGNEAPDFSAGANLFLVLMGARQGAWDMLDTAITGLQQAHQLLKYSPMPVVSAPTGRALGGGCEMILHTHHTRALAETYIGLVEVGVGLIPAGGGCKEFLLRQGASVESQKPGKSSGPFTPARRAFEIIAVATVSTSATEAQELRFLRKTDAITVNRDVLLRDAKADAIKLAEARAAGNWQPPQPPMLLLPGAGARLVLEQQIEGMLLTGKISEHDAVIGNHLARVLTGGDCSPVTPVTEQYVLDLEREAFLSLCGMEKTQDRMQSILQSGKPLRN